VLADALYLDADGVGQARDDLAEFVRVAEDGQRHFAVGTEHDGRDDHDLSPVQRGDQRAVRRSDRHLDGGVKRVVVNRRDVERPHRVDNCERLAAGRTLPHDEREEADDVPRLVDVPRQQFLADEGLLDGERGRTVRNFAAALRDYVDAMGVNVFLPEWVPTSSRRRHERATAALDDLVATLVAERDGEGDDLLATLAQRVEFDRATASLDPEMNVTLDPGEVLLRVEKRR